MHIGEGQPPKMRKHGDVMPIRAEPMLRDETMSMLREVSGEHNWKIFEERGDLDFAYEMDQRLAFSLQLPETGERLRRGLSFDPDEDRHARRARHSAGRERIRTFARRLVLVTGPTGSGKSTTLAALIDYINENFSRHIVTIEEPIEFVHDNKRSIITQREVPGDSRSFPEALKAALREDADIVLVGEMRDLETISLALTAAETGLLVFGTLHTNNARKTVDRMVDVFPASRQAQARAMLANSLRGVLAQLLLKKADGSGASP